MKGRSEQAIALISLPYNGKLRGNLKKTLNTFGSNIDFVENKWFCDKLKTSPSEPNNRLTLLFGKFPEKYRDLIKYFSILYPYGTVSTQTVLKNISPFFKFLLENYGEIELVELNKGIIREYKKYLKYGIQRAVSTKINYWSSLRVFFNYMHGWPELPNYTLISAQDNPFKKNKKDKDAGLYPPDEVIKQTDRIFMLNDIRVHKKLEYWLERLIPSRSEEIAAMKLINCLRPYGKDRFTITMPTWKENGGWAEGEDKIVIINYKTNIEKYLIDLMKEQINISESYQDILDDDKKGLLFTYCLTPRKEKSSERTDRVTYPVNKNNICIANTDNIHYAITRECLKHNVRYNDKPYLLTPKQLRHKGITDRLDNGFDALEVKVLSGHETISTIYGYYDHGIEEINEVEQKKYLNTSQGESDEDINTDFIGKVLSEMALKRLSSRKQVKELASPDGKSIGFCSDVYSCRSEVLDILVCLKCEKFDYRNVMCSSNKCMKSLNIDDLLEFYTNKVKEYESDIDFFSKNNNFLFRDKAKQNLGAIQSVIKKLLVDKNREEQCQGEQEH